MSDHIPDPVKMVSTRDVPRIDVEVFALPLKDRLVLARALVPEYAVVPRDPTPEMCSMGADELPTPTCESTDEEAAAEVYRAMIAASEPTR